MTTVGFANAIVGFQFSTTEPLFTLGAALDSLPLALFLHVYLGFPDGRLRSRLERWLVLAAYADAIGSQLLAMAFGAFPNRLQVVTRTELASWVLRVEQSIMIVLCLVAIGVLIDRRRRAGRPRRRAVALLVDAFVLALLMIIALFVVTLAESDLRTPIQRIAFAVVGLAPVAFLIGLLDARLARSAVGELMMELRADSSPASLERALARALRDPSLTLVYWLPDYEAYADLDGNAVTVPDPDGRVATPIEHNGERVAALLHDPTVEDEPRLLATVGAAAGIALENGRLQAELAARLEEVKGSRVRVLEAGQAERKRLERNLHDGAQQRLVALSLQLKLLEKELAAHPAVRAHLEQVQHEIAISLQELRDLARGLHPAVLSAHGLAVALEQVAARAPVRVRLNVDVGERLPEAIEVAAYFVVSESLANVAKHAHASSATVDVVRGEDAVVVEVVDDGVGGASSDRGSGIRGLADRVEALGGRLRVWTPAGGGTRVRADIPCA